LTASQISGSFPCRKGKKKVTVRRVGSGKSVTPYSCRIMIPNCWTRGFEVAPLSIKHGWLWRGILVLEQWVPHPHLLRGSVLISTGHSSVAQM
jgi:hypothetical protein